MTTTGTLCAPRLVHSQNGSVSVDETPGLSHSCETIGTAPTEGATSRRSLTKSTTEPAKTRGVSMAEPQHKTDPRPQIKPDDHRHGTNAGHVAGCRSECCNLAKLRYDKARKLERHATGRARQVSAVGFKRRAHALNAIGWPMRLLADELGVTLGTFSARVYRADLVYIRTHELMCDLYERLCMTPYQGPQSERTKRQARERGYAPPLAWDDIDNDDAPNLTPEIVCVDEVKVERVLGGVREDCNLPERLAVLERWQGSYAELERITGWNVNRMLGKVAA